MELLSSIISNILFSFYCGMLGFALRTYRYRYNLLNDLLQFRSQPTPHCVDLAHETVTSIYYFISSQ